MLIRLQPMQTLPMQCMYELPSAWQLGLIASRTSGTLTPKTPPIHEPISSLQVYVPLSLCHSQVLPQISPSPISVGQPHHHYPLPSTPTSHSYSNSLQLSGYSPHPTTDHNPYVPSSIPAYCSQADYYSPSFQW